MRVLAISGSLRALSTNTSLLRSLSLLAPPGWQLLLYEELSLLPAFNPDLEGRLPTDAVGRFRSAIAGSAVVVFSTPEYAHGIPGALKNALDWIVGSGELSEKPVALLNASCRGQYAQAALKEVLSTMNARPLHEAEVTLEIQGNMTPAAIAGEPAFRQALTNWFKIIERAISESAAGR